MARTPFAHILILIAFLANTFGPMPLAQAEDFRLPTPGVMVHLSPLFDPPILKGIKIHPDNPFRFDFILDQGDGITANSLKSEATKLIKYFLASLTIPEKDLWVNLSPYEKDRIIPQSFGLTEMGRDLLTEDYMLKQITASLIYPEDEIGKKFWKRIYEEAAKKFGTTNIPVNTFNKVWIVPEKAVVYEDTKAGTAYIVESKLKVMLEQDYLALEKNTVILSVAKDLNKINSIRDSSATPQNDVNALGSQIVREIVIPELTKEVNEDRNFAKLRQVYNSLILATWYKKKIKDSILSQVYANKNKTAGVQYTSTVIPAKSGIQFKNDVEGLYQEYLKAFKKGVYNYIKEELDPINQETVPKKYFSGGFNMAIDDRAMVIKEDPGRRSFLKLAGAVGTESILNVVLRPLGVLTSAAGLLMPVKSIALTLQAQEYIAAQNTREGLQLQGGGLNAAAEQALNNRLTNFLRGHSDKLNRLPYLKKFMDGQMLNLNTTPYSVLINALKISFDGFKNRLNRLSAQDLEDWSNLQADSVQFIQIFLLEDATYVSRQRAVVGLIFGLPNKGLVYNCDAISALTVMIANEMGINGINFAVVKTNHEGNNYPDAQGIGHANNILIKANGKAVVFDQRIKVEPTNNHVRLEAYDDNERPMVIGLSSVGPRTRFMTLSNLLEEEKVYNLFKQIELNGAFTTKIYENQTDLEKGQRVLNEISSYGSGLQRNMVLKENFEKALRIFQSGYYNQVINNINAYNSNAGQLFEDHHWQAAADAFKRIADYVKAQELHFNKINGFPEGQLRQLRDIYNLALQNQSTALSNGGISANRPSPGRNVAPSSSSTANGMD